MYATPIRLDNTMTHISRTSGVLALGALTVLIGTLLLSGPESFSKPTPSMPIVVTSPFFYTFNSAGILNEAGTMGNSTSPYWWLNSGGQLVMQNGIGETLQGDVSPLNRWRLLYALSNPVDTDGGRHPQNLFRLVSKSTWENVSQEAHFYIVADNFSGSPNRNQSNGLLLASRYTGDGQTLYYAGVRVDGTAVIKKKYRGTYYTLAQKQVFPGTYAIAAGTSTSQNLLPHGVWLGLRLQTLTQSNGNVTLALFVQSSNGSWQEVLSATDDGGRAVGNTPPITGAQYTGVRTDFMDVRFDTFIARRVSS
ncbi:MAG: hypothetical protein UY04_C0059G0004 [Parcubacteria group bacterium GW2011_GWA2_47_7]|nr:MAG: hypothetical protein UY04_C0059G0004 [Parcubacteria group bacterium GW2011_GWA2_47_7]